MKRLCLPIALAAVAILLIAVPVLAACYAYIYVEESSGNSYDDLPLICSCNITPLVSGGFISSTGLDTRVLTGDGEALPHMLSNDKILFVSDLAAYEDKTLIFYTGATSLSDFPIIVGYNGSITTPDDPDLELGYVIETLYSGSFDASGDTEGPIHYKEDAWKVSISEASTLRVAALEAGDAEQWEMHYSSFTSGEHTIYVMANGLVAYLYVDDFEIAKDTANLFDTISYQCVNKVVSNGRSFYAEGYYWVFYWYDTTHLAYITSPDGISWSGETTIAIDGGDSCTSGQFIDFAMQGEYLHVVYIDSAGDDSIKYRRGDLTDTPDISWSDDWQMAYDTGGSYTLIGKMCMAVNPDQQTFIAYEYHTSYGFLGMTANSATDGSWSTMAGHPFQVEAFGSNNYEYHDFVSCPDSNKLYVVWVARTYTGTFQARWGKYYNGSSWEANDDITTYCPEPTGYNDGMSVTADEDDNFYVGFNADNGGSDDAMIAVRFDGEVWDNAVIADGAGDWPVGVYSEHSNKVYWLYATGGWVRCCVLDVDEMEVTSSVALTDDLSGLGDYPSQFGTNIGYLLNNDPNTYHATLDLTVYQWNDNGNDWYWMQNNVMPYADSFMMGIDGTLQLHYQPDAIIQGTTLPDEESDHDGTITWGSNPAGVDVSHSELICEETEGATSYYYFDPGSEDIIKPEPETMVGDVDLERLRGNPLYPFVQILSISGFLDERLAWLGIAWFIVIGAMLLVHLGFDTKKNTAKPQHFILTTITGLGLSILFYMMGIFPLWVVILMAFGLLGAIIWERQPVI